MDRPIDFDRYSVRDGRLAPITCVTCGCRLEQHAAADGWWHFAGAEGRDARGCCVACVGRPHYQSGEALAAS